MNIKKLLLFIPVIALSACSSLGKEISEEEASKMSEDILNSQLAVTTYSFSYTSNSNADGSKETIRYKYVRLNSSDYMVSREENQTSKTNTYKASKSLMVFTTVEAGQVLYIKTYNPSKNEYDIKAYTKSGQSSEYENTLSKQSSFIKEITGLCNNITYARQDYLGSSDNYNKEQHFYSAKVGNLTARISYTYNGEANNDTIKKIDYTYKYSNELFNGYNATYLTADNQKKTEVATMSYSNVKLEIPNDWQEHIVQTVSI